MKSDEGEGAPHEASTLLYAKVKEYVRAKVSIGEWSPGYRVPSENELISLLGVSRMTAHRALRELAAEGAIYRIRGKGSFVATVKVRKSLFQSVPNIADEIRQRGGNHSAHVVLLQAEVCGPEISEALDIPIGDSLAHSIIVHKEDDLPIQIEDRLVNASLVNNYLEQDFTKTTPNEYISNIAPISRLEQSIEAVGASAWESKMLVIGKLQPCLLIRRRTWSQDGPISVVRLLYPGNRYRLESN